MATNIAKIRATVGTAVCTVALAGAMVTATPAQATPVVPSSPFTIVQPALTPATPMPLGIGSSDEMWYLGAKSAAVAATPPTPQEALSAALAAILALPATLFSAAVGFFNTVFGALVRFVGEAVGTIGGFAG